MNFSLWSQYLSTYFPSKKELYYNIFRLFHLLIYLIHEKLLCLQKNDKTTKIQKKVFFSAVYLQPKNCKGTTNMSFCYFGNELQKKRAKLYFVLNIILLIFDKNVKRGTGWLVLLLATVLYIFVWFVDCGNFWQGKMLKFWNFVGKELSLEFRKLRKLS